MCELCENYAQTDDTRKYPACDRELCLSCYEYPENKYLFDTDRIDGDKAIPHECPKCGKELEPDINYAKDGSGYITKLLCTNLECDFEVDVTELLNDDEITDIER